MTGELTIHSEVEIRLAASLPDAEGPGGMRTYTLILGPTERSWNPARTDTLLRGPARVTYVFWPDEAVDYTVHEL